MKLRQLPINRYQTVHPYPWLFAQESSGDAKAKLLLDTEVASKFVYSGGILIWVGSNGNWDVAAEFSMKENARLHIRHKELWNKANPASIIHVEENFKLPQEKEISDTESIF